MSQPMVATEDKALPSNHISQLSRNLLVGPLHDLLKRSMVQEFAALMWVTVYSKHRQTMDDASCRHKPRFLGKTIAQPLWCSWLFVLYLLFCSRRWPWRNLKALVDGVGLLLSPRVINCMKLLNYDMYIHIYLFIYIYVYDRYICIYVYIKNIKYIIYIIYIYIIYII